MAMMRELINMGLQSVDNSIRGAGSSLKSEDWDNLARVLHKLRPVLCYCGINCLTDELVLLEKNARERNNLPELPQQVSAMISTLQQVQAEMENYMSSLSD